MYSFPTESSINFSSLPRYAILLFFLFALPSGMSGPGSFHLPPAECWEKEKLTFSCCLSPSATVSGQSGLKRRLKILNTAWIVYLPRKMVEKTAHSGMRFLIRTSQSHHQHFNLMKNFNVNYAETGL